MKLFATVACAVLLASMACAQTPVATLNIDPDTLNFKSQGNWITAYLTAGQSCTWEHGFLPGEDYYNHPAVTTNVGLDTWYSYTSPNLLEAASPTPRLITGLLVGGNGWDFHGKADNVVLSGVVGGLPTGNLISNGDFAAGFAGWTQSSIKQPGNPSVFSWLIDEQDGMPAPCFEYERTDSWADGGWCGLYQPVDKDVSGWDSLQVSYDLKIISNTLGDSGWWSAENGGWGETPARIIVQYIANLDPGAIDLSSVKLIGIDNGADGTIDMAVNLPAVGPSCAGEDYTMVKFDRKALISALRQAGVANNATVALVVTGNFTNGGSFTVNDKIRVLTK